MVPTLAHAGAEPLREAMARSARLSTALATILAQDPAPRVVAALIANPRTPGAVLAQVAGRADLSPLLLAALREHPHCSAALSAQIQARLRAMSA
ncbi:hypothetical protein [Sulfobacillus sp. hq2]|uniref:hypothetical protein n=1 Tax=Sulfobacillus sp. hq2 TaxID=2039167 RepID=UPI0011AF7D0D|nr:hypothetical protein [Sulfobacillus sp. hq2]